MMKTALDNKPAGQDDLNRVVTIPNLLSLLRLLMIPLFVWLYCARGAYYWTGVVLLLSGLTDIVDGFIARHFHMISNLGKILDPVADKLTQVAMLFCLITRFPLMLLPLVLMVLKELYMAVSGLIVIHRTSQVYGANWHGKVNTFLLYAMMILHVFWYDIPAAVSNLTIAACVVMMVVSLALYGVRNWRLLKRKDAGGETK